MNYEEKYNEALERAKSFQEKYGGDYAGYIFPELAESEDERIRKHLIKHFSNKSKEEWNGMPIKDILAWLEKQKEQMLTSFNEPYNPDDYEVIMGENTTSLKQKEQKPAEWSEEDEKDMAHIIQILDDCYAYGKHDLSKTDHENLVNKLKSLRPSWKPSEEQDYSGLSDLGRAIHRGFLCGGAENVPVAIIKETAKEIQSTLKAEG